MMFASQSKAGIAPVPPHSLKREHAAWAAIVEPIRPFLDNVAVSLEEQVQAFDPEISQYAQYALTNQGKQLRPVLVALSGAAAAGRVNEALVTVAVIIEMVHLATLVHDDVMDEAVMRRRRPTLAANWGNEVSVLLGDCLFAHAVSLAASFPTPDVCRAVAMATNRVCSGEILQTHQRRNFNFSRKEYFKVLEMKTAELFALSCDQGASLAGATPSARAALRNYGLTLGTAYQLFDDCVDIFGSEATVGKSLGTDLSNGKLTLPVLVVLEQGTAEDRALLRECIENWQPARFGQVIDLLERYDALAQSRRIIHEYLDRARQSLKDLPDSASRAALIGFTDYLAQQTDSLGVSE